MKKQESGMKKRRQKMHEDRHAKKTQMMNKSGGND